MRFPYPEYMLMHYGVIMEYESITNYTGTSREETEESNHVTTSWHFYMNSPMFPLSQQKKKVSADTEPSSHSGSHARRGVDDGGSARQNRRVDEVTEHDSLIECII